MAAHRIDRPVQLRDSDDELSDDGYGNEEDEVGISDEDQSQSESGDSASASDDNKSLRRYDNDDEDESEEEGEDEENGSDGNSGGLQDISFGALAKAQESLALPLKPKKRKHSEVDDDTQPTHHPDSTPQHYDTKKSKHPGSRPNQPLQRSSKHAPAVLSSKHRVSRKRQILDTSESATTTTSSTLKFRDPRFDAAIKSSSAFNTPNNHTRAQEQADKNYAFLTEYQADEILSLKSQLSKTTDPTVHTTLKRKIMSLESKIRNAETRTRQREIYRAHKEKEKQAIREGKKTKAYFLKPSHVRKQIVTNRLEGMGKKARDKLEMRKVKRLKSKEGREMPRFRRSAEY